MNTIDTQDIPKHIAIMMDGNRRWAKQKGLPIEFGHWQGSKQIDEVLRAASDLGVKILTLYAFSTENWNRSKEEIDALMEILEHFLLSKRELMLEEGVYLSSIGDLSKIPTSLQKILEETKQITSVGSKIELILAINYGGRDEIRRAAISFAEEYKMGKIKKEGLTEEVFARYLDMGERRDPDLLIRTSGEMRVSNFLLWQISYAEILISDRMWPDFTKMDLIKAIGEYQQRERRRGE